MTKPLETAINEVCDDDDKDDDETGDDEEDEGIGAANEECESETEEEGFVSSKPTLDWAGKASIGWMEFTSLENISDEDDGGKDDEDNDD
jgi:hypothetical protein